MTIHTKDYPPINLSPRIERQNIRMQLRLRFNTEHGCYEIYSTIHGTGVFRWFKISESTKDWYMKQFGLEVEQYSRIDGMTGAFKQYQPTIS